MTVTCQLSKAEMREAYKLNRTAVAVGAGLLRNIRLFLYLALVLVLIVVSLRRGQSMDWHRLGFLLFYIGIFLLAFLFRRNRAYGVAAKSIHDACSQLIIDSRGITAQGTNGASSFTPWSAVSRWKEGKLVFTMGDGKTFRTVSKTALGEMQAGELRSLLQSQVPAPMLR